MTNQSNYTVGQTVKDSEGNRFAISSIIAHRDPLIDAAVILRGWGGSKEIGSLDLKFYTLCDK